MSIRARLAVFSPRQTSFGARIVRAGGWGILQIGASHMLRLASNLVMTRLLAPEAFGIMAIVLLVLAAVMFFTDIGIAQSIIREKDGGEAHFLHAAWVVKIRRGILVAGALLAAAALVALLGPRLAAPGTAYADPALPALLAVAALGPLLMGFESTGKEFASRNLQYHQFTLVSLAAQAISIGAMILFAQIEPSSWALLAGMLTSNLVQAVASHRVYPGPKMRYAPDRAIEARLWAFGKWLMGSSIFAFFGQNADRMILASLLSAGSFGLYVIAQIWIEAGKLVIGQLSSRVGFSVISEILRNRAGEAPRLFRRFQSAIDALCLLGFLAACFGGEALIRLLYTADYAPAGNYVAILSLQLLLVRFDTFNNLIVSAGNSRALMTASAIQAVTIWAGIPLAWGFLGIKGVLLAVALNTASTVPYRLWLSRGILGVRALRFDMLWYLATLAVAVPVYIYN